MHTRHASGSTRFRRPASGLTMLELIVALSLAAVVAGAAGPLGMAVRLTALHEGRLEAHQALRRGLERIIEELRWAERVIGEPACAPSGLCPTRVQVRIPGGNPYRQDQAYDVTFRHDAAQREVERRLGGGVTNLASRIDRMEFFYFDTAGLEATRPEAVASVGVRLVSIPRQGAPLMLESAVGLRNRRAPAGPSPGP